MVLVRRMFPVNFLTDTREHFGRKVVSEEQPLTYLKLGMRVGE